VELFFSRAANSDRWRPLLLLFLGTWNSANCETNVNPRLFPAQQLFSNYRQIVVHVRAPPLLRAIMHAAISKVQVYTCGVVLMYLYLFFLFFANECTSICMPWATLSVVLPLCQKWDRHTRCAAECCSTYYHFVNFSTISSILDLDIQQLIRCCICGKKCMHLLFPLTGSKNFLARHSYTYKKVHH
jgi:hypothetical protein